MAVILGRSAKGKRVQKPADLSEPQLSLEKQRIRDWYRETKFRKTLFGGVDEADVWKKLDELNRYYEASLAAERIRYETLLAAQGEDTDE